MTLLAAIVTFLAFAALLFFVFGDGDDDGTDPRDGWVI